MDHLSANLLKRYFAGDCSPAEKAFVEAWLEAHPDHADLALRQAGTIPEAGHALEAALLAAQQEVWERTLRQVKPAASPGGPGLLQGQAKQKKRTLKKTWLRAAAGLSGLLLLGYAGLAWWPQEPTTWQTAYGQVRRLTLPDSTVVYLNGNSRLSYTGFQAGKSREVWLQGEAFFEVRHQPDHQKFLVHLSDGLGIEVLGTQFNVSSRQPEKAVVLKSGRIKLYLQQGEQETSLYLQPGDLVKTNSRAGARLQRKKVNPAGYHSWIARKWVLDDTSLGEMLVKLRQTYGIKTVVPDRSLLQKRASGSIPLPEANSGALLEDIANLFELTIQKKDDTLYLDAIPKE